jgi:hypothetical protein
MKTTIILGTLFCFIFLIGCNNINPETLYTPSEVFKAKESLVDQEINVMGKTSSNHVACTLMGCVDSPCCNSCGGSLALEDSVGSIEVRGYINGEQIFCGGNECDISCNGFELDKTYKIKGIWKEDKYGYYLEFQKLVI